MSKKAEDFVKMAIERLMKTGMTKQQAAHFVLEQMEKWSEKQGIIPEHKIIVPNDSGKIH